MQSKFVVNLDEDIYRDKEMEYIALDGHNWKIKKVVRTEINKIIVTHNKTVTFQYPTEPLHHAEKLKMQTSLEYNSHIKQSTGYWLSYISSSSFTDTA